MCPPVSEIFVDRSAGLGKTCIHGIVARDVTIGPLATNGFDLRKMREMRISVLRLTCRKREEQIMKPKMQFIAMSFIWAVISLTAIQATLAQHPQDYGATEWKKGMVRLNQTAWVGDVRLKSGMYHFKHLMEGDKHMLVFKSVALRAGRDFPMWEGKEVVRLECSVEPATRSIRNTKVILTKTVDGIRRIQEIQIAGEKVRHILLSNPQTI